MDNWCPLHVHSHFSLLDGLSKPYQIADRCKELGYTACALTDHGSISGAIDFTSEMQDADLKPILGCELYVCGKDATIQKSDNRQLIHLPVLAKNKEGWDNLISLVSLSNSKDVFYYKPRVDMDMLKEHSSGLIGFSGHPGSHLANCLFTSTDAYSAKTVKEAESFLPLGVKVIAIAEADRLRYLFGDGNFYIEIQLVDQERMPAAKVIANILRETAIYCDIPCIATGDSHYPRREDAEYQRILLCAGLNTTIKQANKSGVMSAFFQSDNYHIPSLEEMQELHKDFPEELENTVKIADMCEEYEILSRPHLPPFKCPDGMDENGMVRKLCREGWMKKLHNKDIDTEVYIDRINHELEVIEEAGLAGYFLIVQDYVGWTKKQGWMVGPGRGSGSGCLISYLLDITTVDPIQYGLLFERFYNAGRNTADRVSLPDIDCDFPVDKRDQVIAYLVEEYGEEHAAQMSTFGRLQGKAAIKEVLRAYNVGDFKHRNEISKLLPKESGIADKISEMQQRLKNKHLGLLTWVFESDHELAKKCRKDLAEWVTVDDGELKGQYAKYFKRAIAIEGTYKSQGKHAAGVIITSQDLNKVAPMIYDKKTKSKIVGLEMNAAEDMGLVKFDILGLALLDKLMGVNNLLEFGKINV